MTRSSTGKRKSSKGGKDGASGSAPAETRLERDFAVSGLPDYLEAQRTRVFCGAESNTSAKYFGSAHSYATHGVSNSKTFKDFEEGMSIRVRKLNEEMMEFDLIGVSPSFANALRRILISEVPTMAIEHVFFLNNTSTIPDEVVAHRLGLIPIAADPSMFSYRGDAAGEAKNEKNTIVLKLRASCHGKKPGGKTNQGNGYGKVKSSELKWVPAGSEIPEETGVNFTSSQDTTPELKSNPVRPVHEDILIAKLSAGQEIELEAHCTKGTGAEHAKWSPVATAWYRLCPEVVLLQDMAGGAAEELLETFGSSVFSMGPSGLQAAQEPPLECLERIRALSAEDEWKDKLQLRKKKEHYIFTIESTGVVPPQELLRTALDILSKKAQGIVLKL